jgi:DNA-binding CsgD family transcriptional regulator
MFGSFDKLTEAFAAAAVNPARWDAAMDVASYATGSLGAMLFPVRGRTPNLPKSESMRGLAEDYVGGGWVHRDDRYQSAPALLRRGVSSEFDFTTPEEMAKSQYYQDFLGRHGLRWFAGVKVGEGEDVWALTLQRTVAQGPFSPDELGRLAELSRRLAGAAQLACAFGFARMEGALAAFDASRTPAAAIDRSGEVVRLNLSAERLIGADLQVVKKRLVSFNRDATAALDKALHALIWTKGEAFHAPVVLPRRLGRPIIAYPSRLAAEGFTGFAACSGFVAFLDLEARPPADGRALAKAFGLTPAEARLAVRFLAEESLEAAAQGLGISIDTARNQLKGVYQKTGVRRQGEIIALLSRLARF